MSRDIVADGLNMIMNSKRAGKEKVILDRYSNLLIKILDVAKREGYIKNYKLGEKEKTLEIEFGNLNFCKAIKPRFNVSVEDIDKYVRRFLISRNFGIVIISTSKGLMTQEEAYEKNIGGSLIAYFY